MVVAVMVVAVMVVVVMVVVMVVVVVLMVVVLMDISTFVLHVEACLRTLHRVYTFVTTHAPVWLRATLTHEIVSIRAFDEFVNRNFCMMSLYYKLTD